MKIQLKYGLIIGLTYALWTSLTYYTEIYKTALGQYLGIIILSGIMILCIVLGLKEIKRKKYEGKINYAQALFSGITISAIAAIVLAIFNYLYFYFSYPAEYVEYVMKMTKEVLEATNTKPEDITKALEDTKQTYTAINQFGSALIGTIIMGIIVSSIASAFIRNKETFSSKSKDNS